MSETAAWSSVLLPPVRVLLLPGPKPLAQLLLVLLQLEEHLLVLLGGEGGVVALGDGLAQDGARCPGVAAPVASGDVRLV